MLVGIRRILIFGPIEVLGPKFRVVAGKPIGSTCVKRASGRLQERSINAVANQRVGKQVIVALGPHQMMLDQPGAVITGIVQQMS